MGCSPPWGSGERELGIGIAFRKKALESVGGFNDDLQVFEYLDLSLRFKGKGIKTPEMTVLHLEPDSRFTLGGYLRRKGEYGFWHHSLFYLYPRRLSIFAFPAKLFFLAAMVSAALLLHSYLPLVALLAVYVCWTISHYRMLKKGNIVSYTLSNFNRSYVKLCALAIAIFVLSSGELAGDIGKLWGMVRSPTRARGFGSASSASAKKV
jgi:hypothetical protein